MDEEGNKDIKFDDSDIDELRESMKSEFMDYKLESIKREKEREQHKKDANTLLGKVKSQLFHLGPKTA